MSDSSSSDFSANVERFTGFADVYAHFRPTVPAIIVDILTQLAHTPHPALVVDIGSGTGLSTRLWTDHAERVIGVEPSDDMRTQAEVQSTESPNVSYRSGLSSATGLPDNCADIVTISQALHWMEPVSTFAEVARILRPGGIFAAIDNDWPPTIDLEAESLDHAFDDHADAIMAQHSFDRDVKRWQKQEHFARIATSGHFRHVKEIAVHSVEPGSADRMVGLTLSQGTIQTLLKNGISAEALGVPLYRAEMHHILGDGDRPMYFTYRVRLGIK